MSIPGRMPVKALLGWGEVLHTRLRPVRHAFRYPTFFVMLPMRAWREQGEQLSALARNRRAWISFHDTDHGDGGPDSLAWLEQLLAREGIDDADGEIWLQCFPRVLGYAFKPVSFWYCHAADGGLRAIVAEVHNTFGERHSYLLHGESLGFGREMSARKVFHVSPFCQVEGGYRFAFMRTDVRQSPRPEPRCVVRITHDDAQGPLVITSMSGVLQPLTAAALRQAVLAMPLLSLGITARIHWQALRLWLKRVPFFSKPEPPTSAVTHMQQATLSTTHPSVTSP